MKKICTLLLCMTTIMHLHAQITFTAAPAVINHLSGHWTWVRSCGGIAGTCTDPLIAGYTRDVVFSPVSSANDSVHGLWYQNNVLQNAQTVKVSTVSPMYAGSWTLQDVKAGTSFSISMSLTNIKTDTIWLSENCSDCYVHQYARNLTVGIDEKNKSKQALVTFPNPVLSQLNLNINKNEVLEIQVFDMAANLLLRTSKTNVVDVSEYASGVYFIQVKTTGGRFTEKFIKADR